MKSAAPKMVSKNTPRERVLGVCAYKYKNGTCGDENDADGPPSPTKRKPNEERGPENGQ